MKVVDGASRSRAYRRLSALLEAEHCVVLDGGLATELGRIVPPPTLDLEEPLWGTWALSQAPDAVREVSRKYVAAGCDVVSTNTWGLTDAFELELSRAGTQTPPIHWIELARRGISLGREAIELAGREGDVALAFSINGDVTTDAKRERFELLGRVFSDDAPDLILLETMTLVRDGLTMETVELLLETGVPLWLSFRRCREGVCGVHGQHWGGPEGDEFGRMAKRFEEMGVTALLINCLPPDHVPGMLPWLRDFTSLPLGVYPNLGYYTSAGWDFDASVGPSEYADLAARWREEEGADIIGGCCGVRPEHIRSARDVVADAPRGSLRVSSSGIVGRESPPIEPPVWTDDAGSRLYPLAMPEIMCDPGVFSPTQGSLLVWKHLFRTKLGEGLRCLDVGCGTGILAVQLALNGAEAVHAIDFDQGAVANALGNAFRNGVSERLTGEAVDFFGWVPPSSFDLVVASLYQLPVDPLEEQSTHRPLDFWGRNLLDHLLTRLDDLLAEDGIAYVMQLSIIGQARTVALLEERGYSCRVIDYSFFDFRDLFRQRLEHIATVEARSDAYHLSLGDNEVMVAYLLEIERSAHMARS